MAVNTRHDEKDESDELAAEKIGKRRPDFLDYCWIVISICVAIYTYITSNSFDKALKNAFIAGAVYIVLRVSKRAEEVYQGFLALQYRSKIINERLTEIESDLNRRIDSLRSKIDQ